MNEGLQLALSAASGTALGAAFFAGLWWTIRRGLAATTPGLWFAVSFWVRMPLAVAGLYATAQGNWRRLLFCVCGFLVARTVVVRWARRSGRSAAAPLMAGELS